MADAKKYLSKIVKGLNTLWIKDAEARQEIADIKSQMTGSMHWLGVSTSAISDGLEMVDDNAGTCQAVEVTIGGVKYRKSAPGSGDDWMQLRSGDVTTYTPSGGSEQEFVFNDVSHKWQEYGRGSGSLRALAFKDTASANYTPAGTNGTSQVTFASGAGSDFVTGYNNDALAPSLGSPSTGTFATEGETSTYDELTETMTFAAASTATAVTAQGTFSAGSAATLAKSKALTPLDMGTAAAQTFTGTQDTIVVS